MPADTEWGLDLPSATAGPDDRWQNFIVGTKSDIEDVVQDLILHDATPDSVGRMLLTSRQLFVHSYFVYEFAFVGAVWAMFAVEAALKDTLRLSEDDRASLTTLTGKAEARGWLTAEEGGRLRMGAELRNGLVHARQQGTFSVGLAFGILETCHALIHVLYDRSSTTN